MEIGKADVVRRGYLVNRRLRIATRILLGLLVVVFLVVAGLQVALSTEAVQRVLRTRLEVLLSRRLRQEVRIGEVWLSPWLNFLELRQVAVSGPGQAPLLQIWRVRFYPDHSRLLHRVLAFENVVLLRPVIQLPEGFEVPERPPGGLKVSPIALDVDRLQIREGKFIYGGERRIWNAQGLDADLWREEARVRGEIRVAEGVVHLSAEPLHWGKLEAIVALEEQELTFTRLGVDVGGGAFGVTGRVRNLIDGPSLDVELTAQFPFTSRHSWLWTLRIDGQLTGPARAPSFQGVAWMRGGPWPDMGIKLSGDREGIQGKDLALRPASGEVSGSFHLAWKDLSYTAEVRGQGLALDLLMAPSLGSLPVTGAVAVQAFAKGRGLTAAGLAAQATFQVHSLQRRDQPSVAGSAEGYVKATGGRVSLERLQVDLPPNRLTVKGSLSEELNLEVAAISPRVDRVGRLLGTNGLRGKSKVVGRVMGTLSAPTFQGTLTWDSARLLERDFKRIHGKIQLERRHLIAPRLVVTRGKSTGTIHLRLTLPDKPGVRDLNEDLRINAKGQVSGAPRDFLSLFVREKIPVRGRMTLEASVEGVPAQLEGHGHVLVKDATVLGEPWQEIEADLELEPRRLLFEAVRLARGAEHVTGKGLVRLEDGGTSFRLATAGLSLEGFRLFEGTGLQGEMHGEMHGEGHLENPRIQMDYALKDLRYTTIPLGSGRGSLLLEDQAMTAQLALPERGYSATGSVQAVRPYSYNVRVSMKQADLAPLFALTGLSLLKGGGGTGSGTGQVRGNLTAPRPSERTLHLEAPSLRLHGVTFHTVRPIRLGMQGDTLTIASLAVSGKQGWLDARGKIALHGKADVDIRGKIPVALLRGLGAVAEGSGAADLKLKVSGLWASPRYEGDMKLKGARLRLKGHPEDFQRIAGRMDFQKTEIRIPSLIGRWAGGEVKISGTASRTRGKEWRWGLDLILDKAGGERVFAWGDRRDRRRVTGRTYLQGKLTAQGKSWQELQHSLRGKLRLALRDGTFRRYTVLANILQILNLNPDPVKGVPYDSLDADFHLKRWVAKTEDLRFVSDTVKISGVGTIDLGRRKVDMLLGVQPLRRVDKAVQFLKLGKIPVLGRLLFGKEQSVLVVAVEVKGPLDGPKVAAVPEESLGRGVLGVIRRVFELPAKLVPSGKSSKYQ